MIIEKLSYEAMFTKVSKDLVLEYVVGISFNEDRTMDVLLTDEVYWKVVKDMLGGITLYSGASEGDKWEKITYIEAADYFRVII